MSANVSATSDAISLTYVSFISLYGAILNYRGDFVFLSDTLIVK